MLNVEQILNEDFGIDHFRSEPEALSNRPFGTHSAAVDVPSHNEQTSPSLVNVRNEWDPLEEIIVGRASGCSFHADQRRQIDETEEDLEILCVSLSSLGVTVKRPDATPFADGTTPLGYSTGNDLNYRPRDILFAYGNKIIETPSIRRSRENEAFRYRNILLDYLESGSEWIIAQEPALQADPDRDADGRTFADLDNEPIFDAANILRAGDDLFYLVSDTGNERGLHWLQTTLDPDCELHRVEGFYNALQMDSPIALLREGLVLVNPRRMDPADMPDLLKKWDRLDAPEMNLLMVSPTLAIVDAHQTNLMRLLEANGIDVLPLKLRHFHHLGGGFRSVTLDVRRAHG
ncbi:MAG: inosamine-phosphate amidinotransferase 1 [Pseudomonadota bacterium]